MVKVVWKEEVRRVLEVKSDLTKHKHDSKEQKVHRNICNMLNEKFCHKRLFVLSMVLDV